MMGKGSILWVTGTTLFLLLSCNTTEPPPPDNGPDTTSHEFVWQVDTLGDGNSSVLEDVVIIDGNNIWAVGEIYLKDSTGQFDLTPYPAVQWDGNNWMPRRVYYQSGPTQNIIGWIRGISCLGSSDYWLAAGSVFRWDGTSPVAQMSLSRLSLSEPNATIEELWGTSITDLYGVGNVGTIVHFDGNGWQQLTSGTTVDFLDIWGATVNQQTEILAVASFRDAVPQGKALVRIDGNSVSPINDEGLSFDLSGVWFIPGWIYFVAGSGFYVNSNLGQPWIRDTTQPQIYTSAIRGTGRNDIIVAGAYGFMAHFNGWTWKYYLDEELQSFYGNYQAVAFKGNVVCAVGWIGDRAIVLIGRR